MGLLAAIAWRAGYLQQGRPAAGQAGATLPSSGMDILNAYACPKGETRQIIIHGKEDGFSPDGDETIARGPLHAFMEIRTGRQGSVGVTRSYDDTQLDNMLLDSFELPALTVRGIFVTRLKELANLKNDTIALGEISNEDQSNFSFRILSELTANGPDAWGRSGEIVTARLEDMSFSPYVTGAGVSVPIRVTSLLELIQEQDTNAVVELAVSDDTVVDFAGFAVCTKPEISKGTTFMVHPFAPLEGHVSLTCSSDAQTDHCNPYVGDTLCTAQLPVACLEEHNDPLPETLSGTGISKAWTGAEIRFSPPVEGNRFAFQSDVHAYCRSLFGERWRAVNIHDGYMIDYIIARGAEPASAQAWIDSHAELHGNCWALDPDPQEAAP